MSTVTWWTTRQESEYLLELEIEGMAGEWKITRDHLADEHPEDFECEATNQRRSMGWDYVAAAIEALKLKPKFWMFRLYDDDDELYYEGVSTDESFDPLDWARYDSGCTYIKYRQPDGSWTVL